MECPATPEGKPSGLGWFRFARRYLGNRVCFLFLRVLRCFSSPGMPHAPYVFRYMHCSITSSGFPHSEIPGSQSTYDSPRHIGVSPVLHRLLVPRHPPCALLHLTIIHVSNMLLMSLVVFLLFSFQGTKREIYSLKTEPNNPVWFMKQSFTFRPIFLRKEVIQPHLPIRLPCYDFTPIIGPTFGGWLQRLPHRLRVLPTLVV